MKGAAHQAYTRDSYCSKHSAPVTTCPAVLFESISAWWCQQAYEVVSLKLQCEQQIKRISGSMDETKKRYLMPICTICKLLFCAATHFVYMTFSFLALCVKRLAYALGTNFRSLGSCTKYSYPCLLAKLMASSLLLN